MTIENFGGRKFLFAMLVVICAALLVISGDLTPKEFIALVTVAYGIFAGTNAVSHLSPTPAITNIKMETKKDPSKVFDNDQN